MSGRDPIDPLAEASLATLPFASRGVEIRELAALADDGRTPMVVDGADPDAVAVRALSVVDLHGAHVGRRVVVAFEHGDPARPIVMGVIAGEPGWPGPQRPPAIEVSCGDERIVVAAKSQLVLTCGKASITLTRAGKVLISGTFVQSQSSGVNRLKGGAVQIN